ncbi:MAG: HAMP domain-containing histidine kinase [Archaeoglobaceae archaeon]|nr:HAMP domain-containing histidine kinase [Archaeoglobaceae archaeon]MDW8128005.1 HAMP domain-containing sensor histidine kinase [Archaeoglobaceae archaeon]
MDNRIYIAITLGALSIILPAIRPFYPTELLTCFYFLSVTLFSLFISFLIYRASEGESKKFMKALSVALIFYFTFLLLITFMLLTHNFKFSFELFIPYLLVYVPLLSYGTHKFAQEMEFLTPKRLLLPVLVLTLMLIMILPVRFDLLLLLMILDLLLVFIFLSLFAIYFNAETFIYWLMVSLAFFFQLPAKVVLNIANYELDSFYSLPAIFYSLSSSTFLLSLYEVHRRKVKVINLRELEEDRKRCSFLLDKLNELKEAFRLMNNALRYDVLKRLQIISGYVESYELTNEPEFLKKAVENVKRCGEYIEKIGSLERVISSENVQLKPIEVRKVVEEVKASYEIPIIVKGSCTAIADENLNLIFENLIDNAVRHSGTERVEVLLSEIGSEAEIRVVDYGTGIPENIKKELFKEVLRYGETAGLGLGLYIVKKLVEKYGGKVWVEDTKPKGATFIVRLRTTRTSERQ